MWGWGMPVWECKPSASWFGNVDQGHAMCAMWARGICDICAHSILAWDLLLVWAYCKGMPVWACGFLAWWVCAELGMWGMLGAWGFGLVYVVMGHVGLGHVGPEYALAYMAPE